MAIQTLTIPIARNGLNKDLEASDLDGAFSPNMINMVVELSKARKHLGYSALGLNLPLQGVGMEVIQYTDARGGIHHIALTTTMAYEYNAASDQWIPIMPDLRATSGSGTQIQDCEDHTEWTGGTDITVSTDTVNYKEQSGSLKMTVGDDIAAGAKIASTTTFDDSADLSDYGAASHVSFYFRCSKANVQITLHIKDADTDKEVLSFVALTADKWYHVTREVNLSGIDTATSIEIDTETALVDTDVINVDDIRVCGSFSGGVDNRWTWALATDATLFTNNSGAALLITNGTDGEIYYYEGHSGDYFRPSLELGAVAGVGFDFPSFSNVDEIIEFWNHLFFMSWTTTAKSVKGLAFADLGNIDEWTGGTSGAGVLTDSIGSILRAKKLGSDLIVYSEKSITTGRYLGTQIMYMFPTLVFETGLLAAKAVWDFVNIHYFLGTDLKIYGYPGGRQLVDIGLPIEDALFSELDGSKKTKIVAGIDAIRHKLYFFIPLQGDTYAQTYYAWNYKSPLKPWEYGRFTHDVRDFSIFSTERDWYCDDEDKKILYCDEESFYCDFAYSQSGNAIAIFISSNGYVYQVDERGSHAGSDIEATYDTEEVSTDDEYSYNRWYWFSFIAKAGIVDSTVSLYYSVSDGEEWSDWTAFDDSPVTLTSTWTTYRIPLDVTSRKIRFRFYQNSQKDFQIRNPMHAECSKGVPKS